MTSQQRRDERLSQIKKHCGNELAWSALLTLEAIEVLRKLEERPPSYREISHVRGLTVGSIQDHVKSLRIVGLLSASKSARSFKILDTTTPGKNEGDWYDILRTFLSRAETRRPQDGYAPLDVVILRQVQEALDSADLEGSEIEIIIRHRP